MSDFNCVRRRELLCKPSFRPTFACSILQHNLPAMGRQTLSAAGGLVDAREVCGAEGDACCPKCGEVLCWEHLGKPCWQHQSLAVNFEEFYKSCGMLDYLQNIISKSQCEANNLDLANPDRGIYTRRLLHILQPERRLAGNRSRIYWARCW